MYLPPASGSTILFLYLCDGFAVNRDLDYAGKGDSVAHRRQILVLESENLLTASILSLLTPRTEYDVSSVTLKTLESFDQPNGHKPDVIIMEEVQMVANIAAVMELVDRFPKLRLIVLGLDNNKLHIFDKQIVQVGQVSDFLEQL